MSILAQQLSNDRYPTWAHHHVLDLNIDMIRKHVVILEPVKVDGKPLLPAGSTMQFQGARINSLGSIAYRLGYLHWDPYLGWYSKHEWSTESCEILFAFCDCTPAIRD